GYVRFALFAGAALSLILLFLNRRIKAGMFSGGMVALLALDLLIIDGNFIHPKPNTALKQQLQADETIRFLKSDTSLYRIFPLGQELFQDNTYMYHLIQSIGGYSPAKIKIYQEMLDSCMYHGWDRSFPLNTNIVNMLNTKYLLSPGRLPEDKFKIVHIDQKKSLVTSLNPSYLPRAFFVDQAIIARSKTEVFDSLNSPSFQPRRQAILEKSPSPLPLKPDTSSTEIISVQAHDITLETSSDKPALLVLSEIYYPPGWKAYVDGKETEIYKTNYVLRSVVVPEGKHTVEFKYYSGTYALGLTVSSVGWGIGGVLILIGVIRHVWQKRGSLLRLKKSDVEHESHRRHS
ncbi:MAG: YfhO family protein, partial [Bacteroidota bacterium]